MLVPDLFIARKGELFGAQCVAGWGWEFKIGFLVGV
jgi:hypothetical protein